MLRLKSSNAVAFLTEHVVEEANLSYKEGQSLVDELELDQMIQVADRLAELEEEWPSFVSEGGPHVRIADEYPWRFNLENTSLSKETLHGAGLPPDVANGVHVLRGEPDLIHCMGLLSEVVEAQVREQLLRRRKREVLRALQEAGFEQRSVPHQESIDKYVQDPDTITLDEVLLQQKLAWDKEVAMRKQLELEAKERAKRLELEARDRAEKVALERQATSKMHTPTR
ncbi:hypothetical protein KFL_007720050 [Klebsormidium nitens]|uniref:Uncharacterized protein n=1 Tax=Klebsormidium nitens TaxID=105231 RepID=A0A1Y1IKZ0_KLENI|nr:hypothetical protein KFL_007720050 [Klebsormidium nitens]|eukprot:GAQ91363.1 hypothetical protein KFL_007720050 [Klebsormidium nitens]